MRVLPVCYWRSGPLACLRAQIHKIMAGLLDQYLLADNDLALPMVRDMADYFVMRVEVRTSADLHKPCLFRMP